MNRKKIKRLLFSLIVTAIFAIILWPLLDKIKPTMILRQIQPGFILLAFLTYVAIFFFRAARFKRLIFTTDIPWQTLMAISWVHTLMVKLLPSYMGELSYIYLLQNRKVKTSEAIFSLLVVRILDIFFIFTFFIASFILVKTRLPGRALIVGLIGWVALLVLLWLIFQRTRLRISLKKHLTSLRIRKYSFGRFVTDKLIEINNNLYVLKEKRLLARMLSLSLAIFFIQLICANFMLCSINIRLSIDKIIFISTLLWITAIIPIKGICNFGNFEGGWALSFFLLSMEINDGIIAGFYVHVVTICFSLCLGLIGFRFLRR